MKNAGQVFSAICIVVIISINLLQAFKPFEWQRYKDRKFDPQEAAETMRRFHEQRTSFDDDSFKQRFDAEHRRLFRQAEGVR
jgi:hypothetical protein